MNITFYLFPLSFLTIISIIDIKRDIIPNKLILFMLVTGILLNFPFKFIEWDQAITGIVVATATLFLIRLISQFFFQKESMGMGDVKLAGVMGFYIGWELFLIALFAGSIVALVVTLIVKLLKNQPATNRIPFAPYLSAGCLIALLFGQDLWNWYINLFFTF